MEDSFPRVGAMHVKVRFLLHTVAALSALAALTGTACPLFAEQAEFKQLDVPAELSPEEFSRYHDLIKPADDESPWAKITWEATVLDARRAAAAQGKPILIWAGGGSPPLGVC